MLRHSGSPCRISRNPNVAEQIDPTLRRRGKTMRAKPQLREHLLATKMKRWAIIGRCPTAYPNCSPARARRNFSRLLAKYPDLARQMNLDILSAYPPV
jgi:hypothetical protein